jgi:CRISPR-associated protein Csm3
MNFTFQGKYVITANLEAVTGLHIGGTTTGFEIGGVDNPVIRDPLTDRPYIPGSSLKGKLRSLLEWALGGKNLTEKHPKHDIYGACWCGKCAACKLFGVASDDTKVRQEAGPTRLTVRDAFLTKPSVDKLQQFLGEGITTELKTENFLDRVTSEANPRTMERVPAGAMFSVEMIVDKYDSSDTNLLKSLFTALKLLEDSTLGGSGSRGSGKVRFCDARIAWRSKTDFYQNGGQEQELVKTARLQWTSRTNAGEFAGHKFSGKMEGSFTTDKAAENASLWTVLLKAENFQKVFGEG